MLLNLFDTLRRYGVPVTIGEFLDLLQALDKNLVFAEQEKFYHMSRMILVKDENISINLIAPLTLFLMV